MTARQARWDHIVIGAGVMGAATAAALADRGRRVLLLEQFELGHNRGSSHGRSRIFRFSYPEPRYVEMAMEALGLWRRAEERAEVDLLEITGGLDIGAGIEQNAKALAECDAQFQIGAGKELMERFPFLSFDPDVQVLFSPDSGVIAADRTLETFVQLARQGGAELRENAKVGSIDPQTSHVAVRIGEETLEAESLVVTTGAWAKDLLAAAGIDLPVWVTRETVAYFPLDVIPPTLVDWGDPTVYALASPGQGLKAGRHIAGPQVDPDRRGTADEESVAIVSRWVAEHYPKAGPPTHSETCLYTNTDDQRFILERHGNVVVGSPCSGHGFKFAPLIGERLADLALG